jgi:hypothetical protein
MAVRLTAMLLRVNHICYQRVLDAKMSELPSACPLMSCQWIILSETSKHKFSLAKLNEPGR